MNEAGNAAGPSPLRGHLLVLFKMFPSRRTCPFDLPGSPQPEHPFHESAHIAVVRNVTRCPFPLHLMIWSQRAESGIWHWLDDFASLPKCIIGAVPFASFDVSSCPLKRRTHITECKRTNKIFRFWHLPCLVCQLSVSLISAHAPPKLRDQSATRSTNRFRWRILRGESASSLIRRCLCSCVRP